MVRRDHATKLKARQDRNRTQTPAAGKPKKTVEVTPNKACPGKGQPRFVGPPCPKPPAGRREDVSRGPTRTNASPKTAPPLPWFLRA
nr:putative integron gene cassette protein [uncultured bacterium]